VWESLTLSELVNALLEQTLFQHNLDLEHNGNVGSVKDLP
jgi:hypothetical protein